MSQRNNSEQYFLVIEQFIEKIFLYPEIMHKHIHFMYLFPDIEWFNIAGILLQKPNAILVKSKSAWDEYLKNDVHIRKGAKSLRIAIPKLDSDQKLKFILVPCYDADDIENSNVTSLESPIQKTIDRFKGIDRIDLLLKTKNMTFVDLIKERTKDDLFFRSLSQDEQMLIQNYILCYFKKYLDLKLNITSLKVSKPLEIYCYIKEIISTIPNEICNVLIDLEEKEIKKDERNNILLRATRNVTERKISAQKIYYQRISNAGKERIIDEYEILDDEGIPIPFENEVY